MVNWQSPEEIARDVAFGNFMHLLLGLYLWEFCISLRFDWDYIRGKRLFHWPMIFYFANRYLLLFALVAIAVSLNVTVPINCQALYTFVQFCGNATIGLTSINLSIRTMMLWLGKWYIIGPLVVIIIGHWSILLHGILTKAAYVPGRGCVVTESSVPMIAAGFVYAMILDFIVLVLTGIRLAFPVGGRSMGQKATLSRLIFTDGLIYFMIAFLANLIATIFVLLDLNPIMSVIADVPAALASTIVATRVVRRLKNFSSQGMEVFVTALNEGPRLFSREERILSPLPRWFSGIERVT
ncbi:hypothetical protein JAAARDRAFT_674621 [Jaapia argillacea MUCL 33604]|uniref:Transmembrane protein n=1 Tax=Jaapia argillacea MUCL 33604 TaxID=933084 RepID=A0A067PXK9_9AGAM|nr:hypothetical protein JAAARDRAFT_674621 [Jaapia argillacea MUCL 33604]